MKLPKKKEKTLGDLFEVMASGESTYISSNFSDFSLKDFTDNFFKDFNKQTQIDKQIFDNKSQF